MLIALATTGLLLRADVARPPVVPPAAGADEPTFATVDVFIDPRAASLAAYQFEFVAEAGHVEVVGIEGGEHPAFAKTPPYYDPAALHGQHRVILAAYSTDEKVPAGKTRVARVHVAVSGTVKPQYAAKLEAAASPDGKSIVEQATISVSEGAGR